MSTSEEFRYEAFVFKGALDKCKVWESFKLLADGRCLLTDVGSDFISTRPLASPGLSLCVSRTIDDGQRNHSPDCGGDASKGSGLSACSIDDYEYLVCHVNRYKEL